MADEAGAALHRGRILRVAVQLPPSDPDLEDPGVDAGNRRLQPGAAASAVDAGSLGTESRCAAVGVKGALHGADAPDASKCACRDDERASDHRSDRSRSGAVVDGRQLTNVSHPADRACSPRTLAW